MTAPTAAALASRRRTLAASRKRHPRKVPRPDAPTAVASSYALALSALLKPLDEALREALAAEGLSELTGGVAGRADAQGDAPSVPASPATASPTPAAVKRVQRAVTKAARDLTGSRALSSAMERAAKAADSHSRAQWSAQAEALGLDVTGDDLFLSARMAGFRKENLGLIRSLCAEHVKRVGKVLRENAGARVETIARELQEATGASKARAQLIARDQVLRASAQLTRDRHEAAGITEYVWRTSRDQRTRKNHKRLEGTRQKYSDPPVVDPVTGRRAHAGQDYQCRCSAEPILPEN